MDKIDQLVDEVFDGGFHTFGKVRKAEKKIDRLLDDMDISVPGRPYDHPIKMKVVTTIDGKAEVNVDDNNSATVESDGLEECGVGGPMMSEDNFEDSEYDGGPEKADNPQKVTNDINQVPNQNVGALLKSVHDELSEATLWRMVAEMRKTPAYKRYFLSMMEKFEGEGDEIIDYVDAVNHAWNEAWQHPIRRGGGSAYGAQAGGGQTRGGFGMIRGSQPKSTSRGGFGMIKGKNEQDEEEAMDGVEEYIERPKPDRPHGGFGSIRGTTRSGGFGSIKGRPQK